jgi:hypothetical protein
MDYRFLLEVQNGCFEFSRIENTVQLPVDYDLERIHVFHLIRYNIWSLYPTGTNSIVNLESVQEKIFRSTSSSPSNLFQ